MICIYGMNYVMMLETVGKPANQRWKYLFLLKVVTAMFRIATEIQKI